MKTLKQYASLLASFPLLITTVGAHAHVTVSPQQSFTGVTETYTIRVPTERDSATVQVEVEFPEEGSVQTIDTTTDWKVEYVRDAGGRIDKAIWSGGSISPGESEVFTFQAENPQSAGTLIWKAIQTHADSSTAEWVAERGSSNPAPAVEIRNK